MQESKEKKENIDIRILRRYLDGNASDEETIVIKKWFSEIGSEQELFEKCLQFWEEISLELDAKGYNGTRILSRIHDKIRIEELVSITRPNIWRTIMRYAAIFIVAFTAGGLLFYHFGRRKFTNPGQSLSELVVPLGSQSIFILSDGTVVTLNAGSKLKYDNRFGIDERVVELEGEGYFKVAKDAKRPFIVRTSFIIVKALGTEFNIKAYSDEKSIETTLVKGSVRIENISNNSEVLVLEPNQKNVFYEENLKKVEKESVPKGKIENNTQKLQVQKTVTVSRLVAENVNVEPIISWKENRWIYDNQSLSEIASDLERRFDIKINFETEQLKSLRFSGILLAEPIEQVLEVMSQSAPIDFKLKGRIVTLSENTYLKESSKKLYKPR